MINHKFIAGLCCVALLAVSGCSRQQSDWQKTRETNTADSYEQFLKKYPSGEFTAQAQARVKELYEERDWQKARDADTPEAYQAFLKQYPEGKWTEEARIRVENFTLAQAPSGTAATGTAGSGAQGAMTAATAGAPAGSTPSTPASSATTAGSSTAAGVDADAGKAAAPPPTPHSIASKPVASKRVASTAPQTASHKALHGALKTGSGSYGVQLGAFKSGAGTANKRWAELQKKYPKLLAGLSSTVVPKKTSGGHLYRLQAMGLTEKHAHDLCVALKAKSAACVVVAPTHG